MPKVPLNPQTAEEKLYTKWIVALRKKVIYLAERTENIYKLSHYLNQKDLDALGIELSQMDFRTGVPSGAPQFFKPTQNSNWTLKDTKEPPVSLNDELDKIGFDPLFESPGSDGYQTERAAAVLSVLEKRLHPLREKNHNVCQWEPVQKDCFMKRVGLHYKHDLWENTIAHQVVGKKKPHLMLFMNTSCSAQEGKLAATEAFQILRYMLSEMTRQLFADIESLNKVKWPDSSALQLIFPVLAFSVVEPAHCRFIQCYFDGKVKIQLSNFENLDGRQFPDLFETVIRLCNPVPCGDTMSVTAAGEENVNPEHLVKHMGALHVRRNEVATVEPVPSALRSERAPIKKCTSIS
ncbi:hypothetical protein DTO166G4_4378 [Paecilomyces variotii]|uniref:Uncharacterized protein n=1 Tax=Byssochlamys spectabilis TaxID=264951 RepID=A0A443HIB2_BYSSP|nr:hypothetical protein C8Q69DRAFT_531337 [Paecilomyces variotii]KAJ9214112.1 hypothetical protein DTO166G4_4378 [Paecilomyces variotii]KAJ9302532.1 hypothetical protein DTO217A2_7338 [Paecilomyces variotii]KAJ9364916.1 hypothetical protein DTO280E4_1211 [Paecilomyces variotii]KAJ9372970.1 hypothetical protein DTO282E5_2380 [Paecilomyces variotii]RWQ91519.1 hypothetical protein C8Q69DRAFT_531337 [Paecilomyces variotii]